MTYKCGTDVLCDAVSSKASCGGSLKTSRNRCSCRHNLQQRDRDYSFLAEGIKASTPYKLIYGTGGEVAIEKAFESAFLITKTVEML